MEKRHGAAGVQGEENTMDAIRRGALMRIGKIAAGAVGLGAAVGRGQVAIASQVSVESYDKVFDATPPTSTESPIMSARHSAAAPLFQQIKELDGYRPNAPSQYMHGVETHPYLSALRSTSFHWRGGVIAEHEKRRRSALKVLRDQVNTILRSPLDSLEEAAQKAIAGFMEEVNKP